MALVVVHAAGLDFAPSILQRHEVFLVQAFPSSLSLNCSTVTLSIRASGWGSQYEHSAPIRI